MGQPGGALKKKNEKDGSRIEKEGSVFRLENWFRENLGDMDDLG